MQRTRIAAGMAACCLLSAVAMPAEEAAEQPPELELETILVVGEQPGPGLWKVTRGDHVLWILPSHNPLQARMTWRTDKVEARIAESKEVLYPPEVQVEPSIGFFRIVSLLPAIPAALRAGKNPGGVKLQKVVPPATYARWLELRSKYFIKLNKKAKEEDLEEWRPSIALEMLQGWATVKSGLSNGRVDGFVKRTAAKHKVPVNRPPAIRRAVKVEKNVRGMLNLAGNQPQAELACFAQGLEALEPELETMRTRANAWATGDIAKLRALHRDYKPADEFECMAKTLLALTEKGSKDAANARKMFESAMWHNEQGLVQAQRDWLAAAQKALDRNPSTFAVLPIGDLLRPGGYLDMLRARGYTVEDPA